MKSNPEIEEEEKEGGDSPLDDDFIEDDGGDDLSDVPEIVEIEDEENWSEF
jgi:hypothetical protein